MQTCLFPVAGYGTRFLPVTKSIPKEMLPVLTKPLIQYAVEEAMTAGIKAMALVSSQHKEAIKNYFQPFPDMEASIKGSTKETLLDEVNHIIQTCQFSYVEQQHMLGLGHAIYTGKSLVGSVPFAVILPDDVCTNQGNSVLQQMSNLHQQYPDCCLVAVEEVPISEVSKYGVIDGDLLSNGVYQVHSMVEKPKPAQAPSNLAIIGRYILMPEIFDVLENTPVDNNGEIQITDALMALAKQGKVIAYQFAGKRFDCGNIDGYLQANHYFAKNPLFNR